MRVLVTGAGGFIARNIIPELGKAHDLRLLDVNPIDDPRSVVADISRLDEVMKAMEGIEAVVHLAIASRTYYQDDEDALNQARFDINVKGTYNVIEAARRSGVRRFVYTSSMMVILGHMEPGPLPPDVPARPYEVYGLTKYLGEEICRFYARQHDMSVVVLRIATPVDPKDESLKEEGIRPQQPAFPDLARAYRLAVEAPDIDFEVLHIVGQISEQRWDLSRAREVLGYQPEYNFEEMGYKILNWWELSVMPRPRRT